MVTKGYRKGVYERVTKGTGGDWCGWVIESLGESRRLCAQGISITKWPDRSIAYSF